MDFSGLFLQSRLYVTFSRTDKTRSDHRWTFFTPRVNMENVFTPRRRPSILYRTLYSLKLIKKKKKVHHLLGSGGLENLLWLVFKYKTRIDCCSPKLRILLFWVIWSSMAKTRVLFTTFSFSISWRGNDGKQGIDTLIYYSSLQRHCGDFPFAY